MAPAVRPAPGGVPVATTRGAVRRVLLWSVVVSVLAGAGLVLALRLGSYATVGTLWAVLAASVGVGIVVPTMLWIDRLEGEPPRLLLLCFLWGALVATAGALVLNQLGFDLLLGLGVDRQEAQGSVVPVVVAPVVEEVLKASGLALVLLTHRREVNGVVDGIVYAGMVAVGFAFTENVLYLATALAAPGTEPFLATFVLRCLLSPFAHPMMTICVGVGVGMAVRRSGVARLVPPLVGLVVAIGLHVLWNASAVSADGGWLGRYVAVQVPLFLGFVSLVLLARAGQARMIREQLREYVDAGWFSASEVAMVASTPARARAKNWASRTHGREAARAMEAFQDEAAELALTRRHLARGDHGWWPQHERDLLHALQRHRQVAMGG